MKGSIFAALAGFALISGSAYAADMPVKAPLAPPPPVATWTGCYLSAGVGYGMWNQQHFGETDPGLVPLTNTFTSGGEGWLGRLGGGCDYQLSGGLSSWVIGAFGDYDFMSLKSKNFADVSGIGALEKELGAWSVGGRIGYLVDPNLLTFFSGGYTQTRFDQQNLFVTAVVPAIAIPGATIPAHDYHGAFLGGGVEYRLPFLPALTVKTEYRYDWYRSADLPILLGGVATGAGENIKNNVQTVTTSLVYRFNFWH